jgi:hypothetical protein
LGIIECGREMKMDAMLLKQRKNLFVKHLILPIDQRAGPGADCGVGGGGGKAIGMDLIGVRPQLGFDTRDPDLKELIEIAGDNADVAEPLQGWHSRVFGHGQDAFVKRQQAQFPIQEMLGGARMGRGTHDGRSVELKYDGQVTAPLL